MAQAFVLMNAEVSKEKEVFAKLQAIKSVKEAHAVHGVYDILLKVTAPTIDILKNTILNQIRQTPNVRSTLTMIVVEESP